MRNTASLLLHPARAGQLKMLADKWGCKTTEAIERLISEKMERGDLPDITPGLEVRTHGNVVSFKIGSDQLPALPWKEGMQIADNLERLLVGDTPGFQVKFDTDHILTFSRKGRGYIIDFQSPVINAKGTATPNILADLCRQFQAAAATAAIHKA